MSDDNNDSNVPTTAPDAVQLLLQGNNGPLSAEQRNERKEALLKRQREQREKAQQMTQASRANVTSTPTTVSSSAASSPSPTSSNGPTPTTTVAASTSTPAVAAATASVSDAPVRENMVQQAISFLSSPSVQPADEAKKTQFLEKKGLTVKEIDIAKARIASKSAATAGSATTTTTMTTTTPAVSQVAVGSNAGSVPPPVPPRNYAPVQNYPQQAAMYMQSQQPAVVDPNAFKRKLVIAMLISGGLTIFSSVLIQKLLYPMIRGITGARQSLVVSQVEILSKLKEKLKGYKEYLLGIHLGSNRFTPVNKITESDDATKDTKTTVEDEDAENSERSVAKSTTALTTTTKPVSESAQSQHQSTVKQLDVFSKTLETHAGKMNFEQLKATRAMTQDLAEYITKETYALTHSIAYPTSRYYGYNTAGAAASGKGGLSDPTTPESALKSEIRSLKGLLLNWRNFPVAKEGAVTGLPNLVQQQ